MTEHAELKDICSKNTKMKSVSGNKDDTTADFMCVYTYSSSAKCKTLER